MSVDVAPVYRFGRFQLEPERRRLAAEGLAVPVGARAFDILLVLVRHRDRVVTKDELLDTVWRGTVVEENNLAVHVSALRRALGERAGGDRFIATVPGSGYRFVAPVSEGGEEIVPSVSDGGERAEPSPVTAASPQPLARARWTARRVRLGLMAAGLLAVAIVLGAVLTGVPRLAPRMSIAVLPFRSLGGSGRAYFADAVTDDLTTELAHVPRSTVIARASADVFKGKEEDAVRIGRALRVRYLLEGSVLDEGERMHVNAQLIDARSGAHLWADAFDADGGGLGASLSSIVQRISGALRYTLVQVEGTRSARERPKNPDALDLYLQARSILDRCGGRQGLVQAQSLLERSVSAEPASSDALAELGSVLVTKFATYDDADNQADYSRAVAVIRQALALSPNNPTVLTASGLLDGYDGRDEQAETSFRLALSFDPNNIQARSGLADVERNTGHMLEMISDLRQLVRIDPLGPSRGRWNHLIGMGYLMLRQPSEALRWFNRAGADVGSADDDTPLDWKDWRRLYVIAAVYETGDHAHAAALYRDYDAERPHRTVMRLASYDTKAVSALAGATDYLAALHGAGMPNVIDEHVDFGAKPMSSPFAGGDFDPTPLIVPGAVRVTTETLAGMLSRNTKPVVVVNFERGRHAIPRSILAPDDDAVGELQTALTQVPVESGSAVVAMSEGPLGWESYDGALKLVALGYRHVFWYRGGEEAWSAAGYPSVDLRRY